jgi:hypothetical protein
VVRKNFHCTKIISALASVLIVQAAHALPASVTKPAPFELGVVIGQTALNPVRAYVEDWHHFFQGDGPLDQGKTAVAFTGALNLCVSDVTSIGFQFSTEAKTLDAFHSNGGPLQYTDFKYWHRSFIVDCRFCVKSVPGLWVGAGAGVGSARFKESIFLATAYLPEGALGKYGDYSGQGLSLCGMAGYRIPITSAVNIVTSVDYTRENIGTLAGWTSAAIGGTRANGPSTDRSGSALEFDFSGIRVGASIGIGF